MQQRYYSLDIVRGMAALSVLLTHWGGWTFYFTDSTTKHVIVFFQNIFKFSLWNGGGIHPGVVIFIVLSGFCIHLPLAASPNLIAQSGFWRIFTLRRSIRIMPVLFIALLLGIISLLVIGSDNSL